MLQLLLLHAAAVAAAAAAMFDVLMPRAAADVSGQLTTARARLTAAVLLSSGARRELNTFWHRLDQHAHCTPWHRPLTSVILCTDTSTCGWGARLRTHSQLVHFYQHNWQTGELYTLASNHLELMAVY